MKRGNLLWPTVGQLQRVGFADYKAYQRSEHWRTLRKLYGVMDLPQDCPCGKPGSQLHHQHYELLGREWEDLSCLKLLCARCHRFIHGQTRENPDRVLKRHGRLRAPARS